MTNCAHSCLLARTISHLHLILRDPEANCICQTPWAVCVCAYVHMCVSPSYQWAPEQRLLKEVGILTFHSHQEPAVPEHRETRSGHCPSPRRRTKVAFTGKREQHSAVAAGCPLSHSGGVGGVHFWAATVTTAPCLRVPEGAL